MTDDGGGDRPSRWTRLVGGSRSGNMCVFGGTAVLAAIRLVGDHSETWLLWANILLVVVGVVGFTLAALRLSVFRE